MKLKNKELAATYETEMERIYSHIDKFPWDDKASYGAWLAQSFHMTKYTTRVAALTAGNFTIDEDDSHQKGLSHLREEFGHEKLALNDLKRLGLSKEDYPEFMQCRLMIQAQYYFIGRHPSAHFGFVLPLETIACFRGDQIVKAVRAAYGPGSESFIHVHAEVDKGHVVEMQELINLSPEWVIPHIRANLEQTGVLYSEMLARAAHWGKTSAKKAA
jgi:hypothetical protein